MSPPPNHNQVAAWLRARNRGDIILNLLGGAALLPLGALILFVTFWVCYAVTWPPCRWLHIDHNIQMTICAVFMVLLFIGNARTDRRYLSEFSFTTGTHDATVVTFYLPGVGLVSNINPLAPDSMHSFVKVITNFLFIGPRAVTAGVRMIVRALRLGRMDVDRCAAVLALLRSRSGRVAYQDIVRAAPDLNPVKVFTQLADIEGVLFLESEPAGLLLSSQLTSELTEAGA